MGERERGVVGAGISGTAVVQLDIEGGAIGGEVFMPSRQSSTVLTADEGDEFLLRSSIGAAHGVSKFSVVATWQSSQDPPASLSACSGPRPVRVKAPHSQYWAGCG